MSGYDEIAGLVTFRPLERPVACAHRSSPFRASWAATVRDLRRELRAVGAAQAVLEVDMRESDLRMDGMPRADRRASDRARSHRGRRKPERDAACLAWLTGFLAAGEDFGRHSQEVREAARTEGFAQATLDRAKVQLQAESHRRGGYGADGAWYWVLSPDHPAREPEPDDARP